MADEDLVYLKEKDTLLHKEQMWFRSFSPSSGWFTLKNLGSDKLFSVKGSDWYPADAEGIVHFPFFYKS